MSRKDDDCHGHLKQRPQVQEKKLGKVIERAEVEVRRFEQLRTERIGP